MIVTCRGLICDEIKDQPITAVYLLASTWQVPAYHFTYRLIVLLPVLLYEMAATEEQQEKENLVHAT